MKRPLLWLPLILFVLIAVLAVYALRQPQDRLIRSRMVGQPLPELALNGLLPGRPGVATADFKDGKPRLLNLFASWCLPCIAEAPQLMKLKQAGVEIDAIAIRDTPDALRNFLAQNGDPFRHIGSDPNSKAQLAMGSSGVPESFVIDGKGRIVLQHIGDIREEDVPDILKAVEGAK